MSLLSRSLFQLLLIFVAGRILSKLINDKFFLRWLTSYRLVCYLSPTNGDLLKLKDNSNCVTKMPDKNKKKKRYTVSRSAREAGSTVDKPDRNDEMINVKVAHLHALELKTGLLKVTDFNMMLFSADLEWIMDLSIVSLFTYAISEFQFYYAPQSSEYNFSVLWTLLIIWHCIKMLVSLTATYFKKWCINGEQAVCIVSGFVFVLISTLIFNLNQDYFDFELEDSFKSLNQSTSALMKKFTNQQGKPFPSSIFFITLTLSCTLYGVIVTFPGLKFSQLHKVMIEEDSTSHTTKILTHMNYLTPLLVVLMWIKPLCREPLTNHETALIDDHTFDIIRIYSVVILNIIRIILLPTYVQVFLFSAKARIQKLTRKGGITTNRELQLICSYTISYINVIIIQYALPILLCCSTALFLKSTGGYSLGKADIAVYNSGNYSETTTTNSQEFSPYEIDITVQTQNSTPSNDTQSSDLSSFIVSLFHYEIRNLFSPKLSRGLAEFALWWLHFAWFCTSTVGLIYQTYITH